MSTRTKTAEVGGPPGLYTRAIHENIVPRTKDLVGILRRPKGAAERDGSNSPVAARRDRFPVEIRPKTWDPKTPILPEHPGPTLETTEKSNADFLGRGMGAIPWKQKESGYRDGSKSSLTATKARNPMPLSTNTSARGTPKNSTQNRVPPPTNHKNSYVGVRERERRALLAPRHRDVPTQPAQAKAPDPSGPSPSKFGALGPWIRQPATQPSGIDEMGRTSGSAARATSASTGSPPPGTSAALTECTEPSPGAGGSLQVRYPKPGSPSKRTLAAHARNVQRIQIANAADRDTLGEFPPRSEKTKMKNL
jgi:hypothetical protein